MDLRSSWTVKKEMDEIGRIERSNKLNKNMVKSRKVQDGIGDVGTRRGIWMTESRNAETDGVSLRQVDITRGMSVEDAIRSRDIECRRKQR
jgi:hypothetical protein